LRLLAKEQRARIGYADDVAAALADLGASPGGPRAERGARSRSYLYRPEMVGRVKILAEVGDALDAACAGRGAFLALSGQSGPGKPSPPAGTAREAPAGRMRVAPGGCPPPAPASRPEGLAPLGPLRPLLQAVAAASVEGGREVADRLLGARGRLLAAYEPA